MKPTFVRWVAAVALPLGLSACGTLGAPDLQDAAPDEAPPVAAPESTPPTPPTSPSPPSPGVAPRTLACLGSEAARQAIVPLDELAALAAERVERLTRRVELGLSARAERDTAQAARDAADRALADARLRLVQAQDREKRTVDLAGNTVAPPRPPSCGIGAVPSTRPAALSDAALDAWQQLELAERDLAAARQAEDAAARARDASQARLRLGLATALDQLDARAAVWRARLDTVRADAARDLARAIVVALGGEGPR